MGNNSKTRGAFELEGLVTYGDDGSGAIGRQHPYGKVHFPAGFTADCAPEMEDTTITEIGSPFPELPNDELWSYTYPELPNSFTGYSPTELEGFGMFDANAFQRRAPHELPQAHYSLRNEPTPQQLPTWEAVARRVSQGHPPSYQSFADGEWSSDSGSQPPSNANSESGSPSDRNTKAPSHIAVTNILNSIQGRHELGRYNLDECFSSPDSFVGMYRASTVKEDHQMTAYTDTDTTSRPLDEVFPLQHESSSHSSFASQEGSAQRDHDGVQAGSMISPFKALLDVRQGHSRFMQTAHIANADITLQPPEGQAQTFRLPTLLPKGIDAHREDRYQLTAILPASTSTEKLSSPLSSPCQSMSSDNRTSIGESNGTGPTPPTSTEVSPLSTSAQSTFSTVSPSQSSQVRGVTQCPACPTEFTGSFQDRRSNLKRHVRYCHGRETFRCPTSGCNKEYSRPDNLTKHRRTVHQDNLKPQRTDAHQVRNTF
ncbi:MAG: hypothetical protein Q9220_005785 [cf. Caloplaca sp. 1 TL-2023]